MAGRAVELDNCGLLGTGGDVVATHDEWAIPSSIWSAVPNAYSHTLSGWEAGALTAPTGYKKAFQLSGVRFDRAGIEALAGTMSAMPNRAASPAASVHSTGDEQPASKPKGGRSSDKHGEPIARVTIALMNATATEFSRTTGEALVPDLRTAYSEAGATPPSDQNLLGIAYGVLRAVKNARMSAT
jgi:hypothetical protein